MPIVYVIVLQYNHADHTINCLKSLVRSTYPNLRVIVVDNASASHELRKLQEYLKKTVLRVKLMISDTNLGYSGGNNIGIKYALEKKSDLIFLLNNDALVEENTIAELVAAFVQEAELAAASPTVSENNCLFYGGRISWFRETGFREFSKPSRLFLSVRQYLPGMAIMVRSSTFLLSGLLEEKYFLYFEDIEYSLRLHRANLQIGIVPRAIVRHVLSISTSELGEPKLIYYHYRNAADVYWRYGTLSQKVLLPFFTAYVAAKQVVKIILMPKSRKVSKAILSGLSDFYLNQYGKST